MVAGVQWYLLYRTEPQVAISGLRKTYPEVSVLRNATNQRLAPCR